MDTQNITILRQRTGFGMSACLDALKKSENDIDKAIMFLQKQGLKKVDDLLIPKEGQVKSTTDGLIFEVNCETDFCARSEEFKNLLNEVEEAIRKNEFYEPILVKYSNLLKEKIVVKRTSRLYTMGEERISEYNHQGGKIAVLVLHTASKENGPRLLNEAADLGEKIAMHVAASKPIAINPTDLSEDLVLKQKELFISEINDKQKKMQDKIVEGNLNKWYSEVCLMKQLAIWDNKRTIESFCSEIDGFSIVKFIRFELGLY